MSRFSLAARHISSDLRTLPHTVQTGSKTSLWSLLPISILSREFQNARSLLSCREASLRPVTASSIAPASPCEATRLGRGGIGRRTEGDARRGLRCDDRTLASGSFSEGASSAEGPGNDGWLRNIGMVCAESLLSYKGERLERGDGKKQEVADPDEPPGSFGGDSTHRY